MTEAPKATAEGSLARTPFGHVLLYLVQHDLSGSLVVWPEEGSAVATEDRLFVRQGVVVATRLAEPASTMERGILPLFMRTNAPYAFYQDENLLGSGSELQSGRAHAFSLFAASLRGAVREDAIELVLGKLVGVHLRIKQGVDLNRFDFQPRELQFIEVLKASPVAPEEVATATGFPEKAARRLLYLLVATKAMEPYAGPTVRPPAPPFIGSMAPGSALPPSATASGLRNPWASPSSVGRFPVVSGLPGAGGNPWASPSSIGRIPGAPLAPNITNSGAGGLPLPNMSGLGNPLGGFGAPAGNVSAPMTSSPQAFLRASKPPPPPPPASLTPDQRAVWKEIVDRSAALDGQNFFQMLDLPQGSLPDAVREGYFVLVKKFHPDRLGDAFKPLMAEAQTVFRHITEAHDTLTDDAKREAYLNILKDGGGTPAADRMVMNILEASAEFQRAEIMLRRREYDAAILHARAAATLNPEDADYHAFVGWVLHQKFPEANAPIDDMLTCLDRAIELDAKSDKIHYYRGVILRRVGRESEAVSHFEKAAQLNPRNVDAIREVRIAKMRGQTTMDVDKQRPSVPPPRPGVPQRKPSQGGGPVGKDTKDESGGLFGFLKKKTTKSE